MADRDGERVGRVVRRWHRGEPEDQLDHVLDLRFLRAAVTDHGPLDLRRGVFEDRDTALDGGQHRHAARVTQLERTPDIHGMKQVLDGHGLRPALANDGGEPAVNEMELIGKGGESRGRNGAAHHNAVARPVGFDAAVTGALGAGVDAEDSHASEASISFSEMSKLDHTCWTSSWSSSASINFTICCAGLPSSLT